MVDEKQVRYIVRTYDLPKKLEVRLIDIAKTKINRNRIEAFDEQYEYIAELVHQFTTPYQERFARSLDEQFEHEGGTCLHELIAHEYCPLDQFVKDRNPVKGLHSQEVIKTLKKHLEPHYLKYIAQLLSQKSPPFLWGFSANHLENNIEFIKKAFVKLVRKYGQNGRIVLPPRRIKAIQTKPNGDLAIQYEWRHYNGNPLAYYRKHRRVYNGMSRRDLYKFDRGLYSTLLAAGQMDLAIPEKKEFAFRGYRDKNRLTA